VSDWLIRRAEIPGAGLVDLRIRAGVIAEISASPSAVKPGEKLLEAAGGALLPGLHDHHIHLLALAAAERSLPCGPPAVTDEARLVRRLLAGAAQPNARAGLRGVGYHESVAGPLDRWRLDTWLPDTPLRILHRSGALWMLNSRALADVGLAEATPGLPPGVECDAHGRPTGRLFRLDAWLRERSGRTESPDLGAVGGRLARYGVTGLTDATPSNGPEELDCLAAAMDCGALPQKVLVLGRPDLPRPDAPRLTRGAVKILLDEAALPAFASLQSRIEEAHAMERGVAIHCVTRAELVLALTALDAAGARAGDRIEHASVAPPAAVALIARLPVAVVSQPHFLRERGDAYRRDVEPHDRAWLYRGRGFLTAGVPLAGGTDAPFGDPDPWRVMRAAVDRRSASGVLFDRRECLSPEQALSLFTSAADAPGGPPRPIEPGAAADLCLLDRAWRQAREQLTSACVRATLRDGELLWSRDENRDQSRPTRSPTSTEPT
jgi:predicted amidohydrolase YtcJ